MLCIADRPDLIPGLIQSVSQPCPAQPSPARSVSDQMPLIRPAKYTQGKIPKVAVYLLEEEICASDSQSEEMFQRPV